MKMFQPSKLDFSRYKLPRVVLKNNCETIPLNQPNYQCDCDCACMVPHNSISIPLPSPTVIYLELTPACPNHCPGCGNIFIDRNKKTKLKKSLSGIEWISILSKFNPETTMVKLTGGEPTLHPDFYLIIDYLKKKAFPFVLLTTGRWKNPQALLETLSACSSFRGFLISLHGPTAEIHEAYTKSHGSFDDTLESIKSADQYKLNVTTSAVMFKQNLGQYKQIVTKAIDNGAKHIIFARYIGKDIPNYTLNSDELIIAIKEVQKLVFDGFPVSFGNCIPQCFQMSSSSGCTAGDTFFTVDPWGIVRPCNHSDLEIGDILHRSLISIWHSDKWADWREWNNPLCLDCSAFTQCKGGCRAFSYKSRVDPLMQKPVDKFVPIEQPFEEILLPANAVPEIKFSVIKVNNEYYLVHDGKIEIVSKEVLAFLDIINMKIPLHEVETIFGSQSVNFLGKLYVNRFIQLDY
ncbi:radical SAM protein [Chloroflexota bacterium]